MRLPDTIRVFVLSFVMVLAGCSTLTIDLPAVTDTPTGERLAGRIIWHDLITRDIDASREFYGALFGWEFEEVPLSLGAGRSARYLLIRSNGKLIGGMAEVRAEVNNAQWVSVMSVDDVDAAVAAAAAAGGEVLTPPTELNRRGRIAVVRDATGALFGMLQTRDGDPDDSPAGYGEFLWDEVWTDDVPAALDFYKAIGPFDTVRAGSGDRQYRALAVLGRPRFGFLQDPLPGLAPTWTPYIRVADMQLLERVEALGGKVIVPPQQRELGGEAAVITGPSGAGVALQTWNY